MTCIVRKKSNNLKNINLLIGKINIKKDIKT